jgi:N utilization substance protein B
MSSRRKARISALRFLYELDCTQHKFEDVMAHLIEGELLSKRNRSFVENIVKGVLDNRHRIDDIIEQFASAFPVMQMAVIDRCILRIAIWEILFNNDTPFKVAIDEAVEIAKLYGGDSAPRLVNGVLGSVVSEFHVGNSDNER